MLDIKTASTVFQEIASLAILPGEEEEFTILEFHQPFICCLQDGVIKIDNASITINGGIAKMQDNELVVLAEK